MSTTTANDLYPEVQAFLEGGPLRGVVGGKEIESTGGETFVTSDPGSGKQLAEVFNFQAA
ncbi:MAG TPA: aldehyde dehydrogenase, partial [Planctomycetaceae bacterium]|nr:aldehyde dehydrogenase [Planctomycetaceae bacterium]